MIEQLPPGLLVDVAAWRRWRTGPVGNRRWRCVARSEPALLGWTVDDLATPVTSARTDAMQAALVGLAQRGDGDMAITLLVQLRPGLLRLIRWAAACGHLPWPEAVDEIRAVFFESVCRHPIERRPSKIAANLLLDTRQRVTRSIRPMVDPPDIVPHHIDPLARMLVTGTLRAGLDRLPGSPRSKDLSAAIAFRAWVLEEPRSAIADELGIAKQTVAMRLHRLKHALQPEDVADARPTEAHLSRR